MSIVYYQVDGMVARIVREAGGVSVEVFDLRLQSFVSMPAMYGRLTGLGGDPPADQITTEQAAALIRILSEPG